MSISIRPSTIADLTAIDTLLQSTYPRLLRADYPPSVLVTALPAMIRAQPRLLKCGTYYVAEEDGVIRGAGGWTPDQKRRHRGHIRHLVTDHRHLRRGIARALMVESIANASAAGMTEMECWATRTAEPFYQSVGFETLGPMDVQLQGAIPFPAIRMMRSLT